MNLLSITDVIFLTPLFQIWADNMKWKRFEFKEYFKEMQIKFKKYNPKIYLNPNISQWSVFLNINGTQLVGVSFSDLWDTANRENGVIYSFGFNYGFSYVSRVLPHVRNNKGTRSCIPFLI